MANDKSEIRPSRSRLPKKGPGRFDDTERLPWLETVDEYDEPIFNDGRRKLLLVVGSVIVIALFGSLVFYVYSQSQRLTTGGGVADVPVVAAPSG